MLSWRKYNKTPLPPQMLQEIRHVTDTYIEILHKHIASRPGSVVKNEWDCRKWWTLPDSSGVLTSLPLKESTVSCALKRQLISSRPHTTVDTHLAATIRKKVQMMRTVTFRFMICFLPSTHGKSWTTLYTLNPNPITALNYYGLSIKVSLCTLAYIIVFWISKWSFIVFLFIISLLL